MSKSIQLKNNDNEKMYPHPYYPIGSIYLSINNTNPSNWFGGTWEQIAKGRTLVGVDTSQSEFNTVKKTGGAKTVSLSTSHIPHLGSGVKYGGNSIASGNGWSDSWLGGGDNGSPHNNLQPYFTCYIWCRIA